MPNKLINLKVQQNPILQISRGLQADIMTLHASIGRIEWSGMLFYEIVKGDINKLDKLKMIAHRLFPMDIGTGGSTGFDYGADCLKAYEMYPAGEKLLEGFIHTHHQMGAFFSAVDLSELSDNAHLYNFYLSLVVDWKGEYKAKLAIPSKNNYSIFTSVGTNGAPKKHRIAQEDNTILVDVDVVFSNEEKFITQIEELKEKQKQKPPAVSKIPSYQNTAGYKIPDKEKGGTTAINDKQLLDTAALYREHGKIMSSYHGLPPMIEIRQFLTACILLHTNNNEVLDYVKLKRVKELEELAEDVLYSTAFSNIFDTYFNSVFGKLSPRTQLKILQTIGRIVDTWGTDVEPKLKKIIKDAIESTFHLLKQQYPHTTTTLEKV